VTFHDDGSWSYFEDTVLIVKGAAFHHEDSNRLTRVAAPTPNPLALAS
jgi:hypothetical protein